MWLLRSLILTGVAPDSVGSAFISMINPQSQLILKIFNLTFTNLTFFLKGYHTGAHVAIHPVAKYVADTGQLRS